MALITTLAILLYNLQLSVLLFLILATPVFLISFHFKRRIGSLRGNIKQSSAKSLQYLQEALSGYVESHLYDKIDFFVNRYAQRQSQLNRYLASQQTIYSLPTRFMEAFALIGLFALMLINKQFVDGTISLATIGAFLAAAYKLIPAIVKIFNSAGQVNAYAFTVNDLSNNDLLSTNNTSTEAIEKIEKVSFQNVCFSYRKRPILKNFNLSLVRGDFIGISGVSGIGKTTLVNLLLGFLKPESGEIKINDTITNCATRKAFHERISYAKQQSFLIYDTLLKNIVFEDAGYNEIKFMKALSAAGLNAFENKYGIVNNTEVSEEGKNISGGQRQRIALARAFYKDFDLIVLDEPCSELDKRSEIKLLHNLQQLTKEGKIVLFITHNQHSLSFCNKIVSMDETS